MTRPYVNNVKKGWGWEDWIENSPLYCAKILHIFEDKKCSLHYHEKKFETFYLIHGKVRLELKCGTLDRIIDLCAGEIVDIRPYQEHRFTGLVNHSEILEVSTQHFESDSIRIEKGD